MSLNKRLKDELIRLAKNDLANAEDNLRRAQLAATPGNIDLEWGRSGRTLRQITEEYYEWREQCRRTLNETEAL